MAKLAAQKVKRTISIALDDYVQLGLVDNFDGTITQCRVGVYNFKGKAKDKKYSLCARVLIDPDDGGKTITEWYRVGSLLYAMPSLDGFEPAAYTEEQYLQLANGEQELEEEVDEDTMGEYAIPTSEAAKKMKDRKGGFGIDEPWHNLAMSVIKAGFDAKELSDRFSAFEGLHCHFDRLVAGWQGTDGKERKILLVTAIHDLAPDDTGAKKSAAPATTATAGKTMKKAAKPADVEEEDTDADTDDERDESGSDLSAELANFIVGVLAKEKTNTISAAKLPTLVVAHYKGKDELGDAVNLSTDVDYLKGREEFSYDAKTKLVSLPE